MAEFFAAVIAKIGVSLLESLIARIAQALFTDSFAPANA